MPDVHTVEPSIRLQRADRSLIIWRLTDGKPGHEHQTRGLCQALSRLHTTEIFDIPSTDSLPGLIDLFRNRYPAGNGLPDPQLIIGAGHATHAPMLIAKRARGGRCIVLMKPSLPLALFDLCLIPEHDEVPANQHVLTTQGALNTIQYTDNAQSDRGLMLIGGPSAHHGWQEEQILSSIRHIARETPDMEWQITDSRRTPDTTSDKLDGLNIANLVFTPCADTAQDWVATQLAQAAQVWVSADSVSMIYEALSSGAATGLLEAPVTQADRITRGVDKLLEQGLLTPYQEWQQGRALQAPPTPFAEADRCAAAISQRWLQ